MLRLLPRLCLLLLLPVLMLATVDLGRALADPRASHRPALPVATPWVSADPTPDPAPQPAPSDASPVAANDAASEVSTVSGMVVSGVAGAASASTDPAALSAELGAVVASDVVAAAPIEDRSWMDEWHQGVPAPPKSAAIPVLMYHHVAPIDYSRANSIEADLTVLPAEFEKQLSYMRSNGYNTVSLREVWNYFQGGKELPPKAVVLTFDDGYNDCFSYAGPLLSRYGLRGTFFIITGLAGQPRYMDMGQVLGLFRSGMEIGAHSSIHPSLPTLSPSRLVEELVPPKKNLEEVTGAPVLALAYPSGAFDQKTMDAVRKAGYRIAVTTKYGAAQQRDKLLEMVRVRVHGAGSLATFQTALERYYPSR
jgi:peptidoglycan/xylan/chitin deacetylase (PgdA/CDA1 family)